MLYSKELKGVERVHVIHPSKPLAPAILAIGSIIICAALIGWAYTSLPTTAQTPPPQNDSFTLAAYATVRAQERNDILMLTATAVAAITATAEIDHARVTATAEAHALTPAPTSTPPLTTQYPLCDDLAKTPRAQAIELPCVPYRPFPTPTPDVYCSEDDYTSVVSETDVCVIVLGPGVPTSAPLPPQPQEQPTATMYSPRSPK